MSSVAEGVFLRDLPWSMIWIGGGIAAAIIAADRILEARESAFRMPVLAVAVGIYLPLELTVPIFVGGIVAWAAARRSRGGAAPGSSRAGARPEGASGGRDGLLFASGLITGEALVGILLAIPFAAAQSTDVLRLAPEGFGPVADLLGVSGLLLFTLWLYRVGRRARAPGPR